MGNVRDLRDNADGDQLRLHDLEALLQQSLALPAGGVVIKEDVKGIFVPVLRVDAVGGEAAAQAVAAVVHGRDGFDDPLAADPLSFFGKDARDRAAGGNPDLPFLEHKSNLLLNPKQKASAKNRPLKKAGSCERLCSLPISYQIPPSLSTNFEGFSKDSCKIVDFPRFYSEHFDASRIICTNLAKFQKNSFKPVDNSLPPEYNGNRRQQRRCGPSGPRRLFCYSPPGGGKIFHRM